MPLPLSTKVTPPGRAPLSLRAAVGFPVVVTENVPALPTVNVVEFALVIAGAVVAGCTSTAPISTVLLEIRARPR